LIVSAHQPNFAPWVGFFDKMLHSDVLVLLDTVQFIKRGYQNRTRVKGPGGAQWLTVPVVTKGRYDQLTSDVEIDESADWRRVHLRTLRTVLAKAPYLDELCDCVEPAYQPDGASKLAEFNVVLIRLLAGRLGSLGCDQSMLVRWDQWPFAKNNAQAIAELALDFLKLRIVIAA